MKLQRSTLILMLVALSLGGVIYYNETQVTAKKEAAKSLQQKIFDFQENDVQSLTVKTEKQTLMFERVSEKDGAKYDGSRWMLKIAEQAKVGDAAPALCTAPPEIETPAAAKTPATCESPSATKLLIGSPSPATTEKAKVSTSSETLPPLPGENTVPASDASVAYLLNLLSKSKSERSLVMTDAAKQRQEFGLDVPVATVEVTLKNQQNHRLILGKPDFNKSFLYAQVDPPADPAKALNVVLVTTDFENATLRPVSEWKQPEKTEDKSDKSSPAKNDKNSAKDKETKPTVKEQPSTDSAKDKGAEKSAHQKPAENNSPQSPATSQPKDSSKATPKEKQSQVPVKQGETLPENPQ